jgi:hypothetical protein
MRSDGYWVLSNNPAKAREARAKVLVDYDAANYSAPSHARVAAVLELELVNGSMKAFSQP